MASLHDKRYNVLLNCPEEALQAILALLELEEIVSLIFVFNRALYSRLLRFGVQHLSTPNYMPLSNMKIPAIIFQMPLRSLEMRFSISESLTRNIFLEWISRLPKTLEHLSIEISPASLMVLNALPFQTRDKMEIEWPSQLSSLTLLDEAASFVLGTSELPKTLLKLIIRSKPMIPYSFFYEAGVWLPPHLTHLELVSTVPWPNRPNEFFTEEQLKAFPRSLEYLEMRSWGFEGDWTSELCAALPNLVDFRISPKSIDMHALPKTITSWGNVDTCFPDEQWSLPLPLVRLQIQCPEFSTHNEAKNFFDALPKTLLDFESWMRESMLDLITTDCLEVLPPNLTRLSIPLPEIPWSRLPRTLKFLKNTYSKDHPVPIAIFKNMPQLTTLDFPWNLDGQEAWSAFFSILPASLTDLILHQSVPNSSIQALSTLNLTSLSLDRLEHPLEETFILKLPPTLTYLSLRSFQRETDFLWKCKNIRSFGGILAPPFREMKKKKMREILGNTTVDPM